jgi:hypothetical protein
MGGRKPKAKGGILSVGCFSVCTPTCVLSYLLNLQGAAILVPLYHGGRGLCIHRAADIAVDSHGHINHRGHVEDTGWVCKGVG